MDGRAFLAVAKELAQGATEAHWRAAAGRAYYGLLLEAWAVLEGWGFTAPPHQPIHTFVRLRFDYAADPDLKKVGHVLDQLSRLRNHADYKPAVVGPFVDAVRVKQAIQEVDVHLALLDQVQANTSRRAAVIADIRSRWP